MLNSIETLAGTFKQLSELQDYSNQAFLTIQKLESKNLELEQKISHLEKILITSGLIGNDITIIQIDDGQLIAEMELKRLKEISFKRGFTLEETKRFDLCVKNLQLIKEGNKEIIVPFKNLNGLSQHDLLQIASQPDELDS